MYVGNLNDLPGEEDLNELFRLVLRAVRTGGEGRAELVKDLVYANYDVSFTEPAADRRFEYHREFMDIHVIRSGREAVGFAPRRFDEAGGTRHTFDESRDLGFVEEDLPCDYANLNPGDFAVFLPLELHKPLCAPGGVPGRVEKIVLKVRRDFYGRELAVSV